LNVRPMTHMEDNDIDAYIGHGVTVIILVLLCATVINKLFSMCFVGNVDLLVDRCCCLQRDRKLHLFHEQLLHFIGTHVLTNCSQWSCDSEE
jgi:hypothetical protein